VVLEVGNVSRRSSLAMLSRDPSAPFCCDLGLRPVSGYALGLVPRL
jgi:hypothetical protein